jgi:hypothetical protein
MDYAIWGGKMKEYTLTVDESQLQVIRLACDTYSRLNAWQFRVVFEALEFENENKKIDCLSQNQCSEIEKAITAIIPAPVRFVKTNSPNVAYDIHKVICHHLHHESKAGYWTVHSSPPTRCGNSLLMKIESKK